MQLSEHFPLLPNLRVRHLLGDRPIHVNSGYRCPDLNAAVGGAPDSLHMKGLAADILCPQFGVPLDVCRAIAAADVRADQIVHEFGKWCHVGFAPAGSPARLRLLTIASAAEGYRPGLNPIV